MMPRELLAVYNHETAQVGQLPIPFGPNSEKALTSFLDWCTSENVDPARYIRARHEASGWRYRVPLGRLASDRFLDAFRRWGDARQADEVGQDRAAGTVIANGVSGDLHPAAEAIKGALLMDREVCYFSVSDTLGWNPASRHCSTCSLAPRCRAALPEATRRERDALVGTRKAA